MKNFKGRVAVITGASSGIGKCLALQLAQRGCHLALVDRDIQGLEETGGLVGAMGVDYTLHEQNVSDRESMEALAATIAQSHGGVNMVFNNAGVSLIDRIDSVSYDDFEWIMNINFWGVVYGTKAFLPYLKQADEAHITNISSLFGLVALPSQAAYNASKFAVRGFTESLKMELAGTRVGVSSVHPGGIKTSIVRNARVAEKTMDVSKKDYDTFFERTAKTTPEKAAADIIKGIEKKRRRILVGMDAKILDFVARVFPSSYERILGLEKPVLQRAEKRAKAREESAVDTGAEA